MFGFGGASSSSPSSTSSSTSSGGGLSFGGSSRSSSTRSSGGLSFGGSASRSSPSPPSFGGSGGLSFGSSVSRSSSSRSGGAPYGGAGGYSLGTAVSGSGASRTASTPSYGLGSSAAPTRPPSPSPSRSDDDDDRSSGRRLGRGGPSGGPSLSFSSTQRSGGDGDGGGLTFGARGGGERLTPAQGTPVGPAPAPSPAIFSAPSFGYGATARGWQPAQARGEDAEEAARDAELREQNELREREDARREAAEARPGLWSRGIAGLRDILTGEIRRTADGRTVIESPEILRWTVPGQVAWDDARTAYANDGLAEAGLATGVMLGEIGLTVATAGIGGTAVAGARAVPRVAVAPPLRTVDAAVERTVTASARQLQRKFKHAPDFGITGPYNTANRASFAEAVERHVSSPATRAIPGTYHRQAVTHFVDPRTGLNVMRDADGAFISGYRLNAEQLRHVLATGRLGGG